MKLAHFYPHSDILTKGSGPSLRTSLLLKFLKEHVDEIHFIAPENSTTEKTEGNIHYHFFKWTYLQHQLIRARRILKRNLNRDLERFEVDMIHNFIDYKWIGQLRQLAETWIPQCDAVLLEYPYWAEMIGDLCKKYKKPFLLTAHDVHALTFAKPNEAMHETIFKFEKKGLQKADHLFCVSPSDKVFYQEQGFGDVTCAINAIDVEACRMEPTAEEMAAFRSKHALGDKQVCMFVGQAHHPNIEAVEIIKKELAPQTPECHFIIAGTCAREVTQSENYQTLGFVSDADLRALYGVADIIIMPLLHGTGTSLKLVESLACAKPILATSTAARGYDVETVDAAIIEDELGKWPELITTLLGNEKRREALSQNANQCAEQYDYKTVYRPYWELLKSL